MKPYSRSDRVGGQIQKLISELLQKRISDPRLAKTTVSSVKMTSDLRIAKTPTTTDNQAFGVLAAIDEAEVDLSDVDLIVHGTTTTTNATSTWT